MGVFSQRKSDDIAFRQRHLSLRKALLTVLLALGGMLAMISVATLSALSAYTDAYEAARHRQESMELMDEVHREVELLRVCESFVRRTD